MELKAYIQILLKKWWIIVPVFLITVTAGIVFTYTRTPLYKATTSYVVVPSSSLNDIKGFASGLDMLGRRDEIATTFAEIASTRRIKRVALDSLSLESGTSYAVSSKLRAGTNIIEVSVEGPDPATVRELTNGIGSTLEQYVKSLYEVFTLVLLDPATTPTRPVSPNYVLNFVLSVMFGLVLGAGLAFLSQYLETPLGSAVGMNIIDPKTGVYNREYFLRRLNEEMIRAKRNRYPLSLALMRVDNLSLLQGMEAGKIRDDLLRQVATRTNQYLREEDIVAYLENETLALLLPDMTGENAKALMEYLQTLVSWTPFEADLNGPKFNLKGVVGITTYNHNGTSRDELLARAKRALQLAEVDGNGKTYMITPAQYAASS